MMRKIKLPEEGHRIKSHEWYLVCVPDFCESYYDIAWWNGKTMVSQSNDEDITKYVESVKDLNLYTI